MSIDNQWLFTRYQCIVNIDSILILDHLFCRTVP